MISIKDQSGNVFLRHFGQLFGEERFESDEMNESLGGSVVGDDGPSQS